MTTIPRPPSIKRVRVPVNAESGRVAPVGSVELDQIESREHAAWMQKVADILAGYSPETITAVAQLLEAHKADFTNPHRVTAAQVGADPAGSAAAAANSAAVNLASHTSASSVHGVGAASVVAGTNTTQTLTNKTVPDLQFSLTGPTRALTEGLVFWDTTAKTLAAKLDGPDVTLQIGQEMHIRCVNKTGADIPNGKLVYIAGAQGNRPKIVLAKADAHATATVIGMTTELIEDNGNGYVTVFGDVRDLDTSAFTAGDVVYLSAATAGEFTKTAPTFPNYVIEIGHVVVADATAGVITLRPGINVANHVTINALGAKTAKFGTGTNYSEFEADGTLVAKGAATTYDDSQAAVYYMRIGGTALTLDVLSGGIYAYRFDSTDEVHSQIQTTHRYKLGSQIHLHIHLINKNAIGATNYNVGVELEWGWVGIDQVMPATITEATVDCSFQNASALTHKVFELKSITPSAAQNSISSILFFRVKRVTATTQNYATNDIFIAGIDFHNEMDTQGSRQEYIK